MDKDTLKASLEHSAEVQALPAACSDEAKALAFIERQRWGDCPCCPRCGDTAVYRMTGATATKRGLWRCRGCKKQFTVRVGTIFEDSHIPLRHWCFAFWAACASKKGVSALQIKRQTGLSYKSALFLMHRIRFAMTDDHTTPPKMTGVVESDETFVGGKPRANETAWRTWPLAQRRAKWHELRAKWSDKTPVVAVVERGGDVRTKVIASVTAENLRRILHENVDQSARLITDDSYKYRRAGEYFPGGHQRVNHSAGEYVRGDVYTNTVEGFFSLLKRKLNGTHHAVSKKHLHRYCNEAAFIYNNRQVDDGERTRRAIRKSSGKRLTYRQQVGEGA